MKRGRVINVKKGTLIFTLIFLVLAFFGNNTFAQPTLTWAKQIGGTGYDQAHSIKVDAAGNTYSTGTFRNTVDFDPGPGVYNLTSDAGSFDIYILKLDVAGNFVWAKKIGGLATDYAQCITIDIFGDVLLTGRFGGPNIDFDPGPGVFNLSSFNMPGNIYNQDVFVLKLDSAGNFIWAKNAGGGFGDHGNSITTDGAGNVLVTGFFDDPGAVGVDFDPGPGVFNLTSLGSSDIFIWKLDVNGNFVWAKSIGGAVQEEGRSIEVDAAGNVYTVGHYNDNIIDFDPGPGVYNLPASLVSAFILKLSPAGDFLWAKHFSNIAGVEEAYSVAIDNTGNAFLTGRFTGTIDFDPGPGVANLTSAGGTDCFIVKLDPSGNYIRAINIGGANTDVGSSLRIAANGDLFIFGEQGTVGNVDYDPSASVFNLNNPGPSGAFFFAQYDNNLDFICAFLIADTDASLRSDRQIDIIGTDLYFTSQIINATADFDPCVGVQNLPNNGLHDIVVAKYDFSQCSCIIPILLADFSSTDSTLCIGECIDFTDLSTGSPTSWEWTFIGADTPTSSDQNPTNICYNTAGSFDVQLIITDGTTIDTLLMPNFITVNPLPIITSASSTNTCLSPINGTVTVSSNADSYELFNAATGVSTGQINTTGIFTTLDVGTYYVVASLNGCINQSMDLNISSNLATGIDTQTACNTYTWIDGNTYTTSNNTATFNIVGGATSGCDSLVTLNLTILNLEVNLGPDTMLCSGDSLILDAENTGSTYLWQDNSSTQTISVNQSGTYFVTVTDGICEAIDSIEITVENPVALFSVSDTIGCSPLNVNFTDLSVSSSPITSWLWSFGDGNTSLLQNPTHVYNSSGSYNVNLVITTASGCTSSTDKVVTIEIFPQPIAAFTFSPSTPEAGVEVLFEDQSTDATTWNWNFGDESTSNIQNPVHVFATLNNFNVTLTVTNGECTDSVTQTIVLEEDLIFYVPNAFTPDGDAYNNVFQPVFTSGFDPYDYHLMLFNRWGELIFESYDATIGWDGTYKGKMAQDGTYVWKIEFGGLKNDKRSLHSGHVNLIR